MPLLVNLRHLARHDVTLQGEMTVAEMEIESRDEMIELRSPLKYDLTVQRLAGTLLVKGRLELTLACCCVRCLKAFEHRVNLADWSCQVFLEGEETVVRNDCVDLTPQVREDILLAFPQHPLCEPECRGLSSAPAGNVPEPRGDRQSVNEVSAWSELDKLKF